MTSLQTQALQPPNAVVLLDKRPLNETFTLPDMTPINVTEVKDQKITISLGKTPKDYKVPASKEDQGKDLGTIVEFMPISGRKARVSLHGVVEESRAQELDVWELRTFDSKLSFQDIWCSLYGFWIRRDEHERFPIQVGSHFSNQEKVFKYLIFSGLAFHAPDAKDEFEVLLDRSAFWQGAGAPLDRSWLRSPQPHPMVVGDLMSTSFPYVLSFTKSIDPPVLTTHPLRPPKPPAGAILYSRYIHSVGSHLQFFHIDPSNEDHFDKFSSWMNSDRVDSGWCGKGDAESHRKYLQTRMDDPHTISYISTWDGELAGYGEFSWGKEDSVATFAGGLDDYDQGTRSLVGEEKFRGRHQFAHTMISTKHFCFLREARTHVIVGDPQSDLDVVELLRAYLPVDVRKIVDLPHKRAALFKLHRDRFFTDAMFY